MHFGVWIIYMMNRDSTGAFESEVAPRLVSRDNLNEDRLAESAVLHDAADDASISISSSE